MKRQQNCGNKSKIPLPKGGVPEAYGLKQQNQIFEECENKGIPCLLIKKGRKYGKIEYDFVATNYVLKDRPLERVKLLFEDMNELSGLYKLRRPCFPGHIYGVSDKCELGICRDMVPFIWEVIYNPNNWQRP